LLTKCDDLMITFFFSELREGQASKCELLFNTVLCGVSYSNQFLNELGSCVMTNAAVSQTQKQGATVKNTQFLVTHTRIFRTLFVR